MNSLSLSVTKLNPLHGMSLWLRALFSWRALGIVVCAVLLAKWAWVFFAPADVALPATVAWKKSAAADQLFGNETSTATTTASSMGNIRLIGVFAHATRGFAVLLVDGKQVGVGLGELAAPGVRLVETNADHVMLERGGAKVRIDLPAGNSAPGSSTTVVGSKENQTAAPNIAEQHNQVLPEQRAAMQQELDHFRRRH